MRPYGTIETSECWRLALENVHTPTVFSVCDDEMPEFRDSYKENLSAKGAYVLAPTKGKYHMVSLLVTGREVKLAMDVHSVLEGFPRPYRTQVVSMPCFELLDRVP